MDYKLSAPPWKEGQSIISWAADVVDAMGSAPFAAWYGRGGTLETDYSFAEIWQKSGRIAKRFKAEGLEKGDKVVMCYSFGMHDFLAFMGCLRIGVVPAFIYPPNPRKLKQSVENLTRTVERCGAKAIILDSLINKLRWKPFGPKWPTISYIITDSTWKIFGDKDSDGEDVALPDVAPTDPLFLQYTSGSTGEPKGIIVTDQALCANIRFNHYFYAKSGLNDWAASRGERLSCFSWVPHYHDMGLVTILLSNFFGGLRAHYCSPFTFLVDPVIWLSLITKHQCHVSMAPDFAYALTARKFREKPVTNVDLSSLYLFNSGGEPLNQRSILDFEEVFQPLGLRKNWFHNCYGIGECVCSVSSCSGIVMQHKNGRNSVCIGNADHDCGSYVNLLRIVDPNSLCEVPEGTKGELWISSPSVAGGYFEKSKEENDDVFRARIHVDSSVGGPRYQYHTFLRTGDLAFTEGGKVFICGRIKDMIIFRGENYFPQDVESMAQCAGPETIRPGCIAAFTHNIDSGDLEIVFEIRKGAIEEAPEICKLIYTSVYKGMMLKARRVVAIKEKTIPKTTSGKIQRRAIRQALRDSNLQIVHDAVFGKAIPVDEEEMEVPTEVIGEQPQLKMQKPKVCVVGAGMSGLVSAKTCLESGLDVTVFESRETLGGVWAHDSQYYSATSQVGDGGYEFFDMVNTGGGLTNRDQNYAYAHHYASESGVLPCCQFGVEVLNVLHNGQDWNVTTRSGIRQDFHKFKFVVVSTGMYSNPKTPDWSQISGKADFLGEIIHSSELRSAKQLSEKCVLVIGGGRSSIDVVCMAVEAGAKATHHVWRSNLLMVYNSDFINLVNYCRIVGETIPYNDLECDQKCIDYVQSLLEKECMQLKLPEHMFPGKYAFAKSNVAITRDEYLDLYKSGAFTTERATVASFKGPKSVVLSTDTIVDADIIILATGYQLSFPFLDESIQRQIGIKPLKPDGDKALRLYRGIIPVQDHKNIAFVGYIQGLFDLVVFQTQANWVAGLFSGQFELPGPNQRDSDVNQALSFMRRFNKHSDGTCIASWQFQYMKKLLNDMSIPFDLTRAMSHGTVNEFRVHVCKQLEDFSLTRSAIASAQNSAQPRVEHQMPHLSEKTNEEGSKCHLPKFLAEIKYTCQTKDKEKVFARWYDEDGTEVETATFFNVWKDAMAFARCTKHEWSLSRGDRVVLVYSPGIQILPIILGCFLSGVVPTLVKIINPHLSRLKESIGYFLKIVQNFRPSLCFADGHAVQALNNAWFEGLSTEGCPKLIMADDKHLLKLYKKYDDSKLFDAALNLNEDDVAFVQYKSGSPHIHGVVVTYEALQSNVDMINDGLHDIFTTRQGYMPRHLRCFNWLPQCHEMGLMQFLMPFQKGWEIDAMSPRTFTQKPLLWLELMSSHGTQYTFAPDFAYALCCQRFQEVVAVSGTEPRIDLKKLLVAGIGAEPIRLHTLKLFTKTFMPLGFQRDAFVPLYGLAESVLMISYMKEIHISADTKRSCVAVGSRELFTQGLDIKVVDVETCQELPDGQEGEIWVQSSSVSPGYFEQKEKSLQVFHGTLNDLENNTVYLRTGDLGYFESVNLFISGRLENVIVSGDKNFYPSEIEDVVQNAAPSYMRPGCVAAFSLDDSAPDGKLCIVFEIESKFEGIAAAVALRVSHAVNQGCGLPPFRVVAIPQKTIPKTTSGIVHRSLTKEKLQMGLLILLGEAKVDTSRHQCRASSKDSAQLPPDVAMTEWKETQVERQEQILQFISEELRHVVPPFDNVDIANMLIFDAGLDVEQLGKVQKSISNRVGLATPLGTGPLLNNSTFHELAARIERLRFLGEGSEDDVKTGDAAVQSMEVKPAKVTQARKRQNMEKSQGLQKLMNSKTSRYEYCAQLPMIPEKRLSQVNVLIVNVMGFFLAFLMISLSLYIASTPFNWAKFTLRSGAAAIAFVPFCYVIFIGVLLLWLWCIRVSLLPSPPIAGRYPIYGSTHLRCWVLEVCLTATRYAFSPFSGTCVNTWLFRAIGARIGNHVTMSSHPVFSNCLLTVLNGATCESEIPLQCHMFVSSMLVMAPIYIGCNVSIKDAAIVEPGASMMGGSSLDMCSTIPMDWTAPAGVYMIGSPAQASKIIDTPALKNSSRLRLILAPFMPFLLAVPLFIQISVFLAILSPVYNDLLFTMKAQPVVWLAMLVSEYAGTIGAACLTIVTKWCLVQRLRAGPQSYWTAMKLEAYELCAEVLFPLYRFLPPSLVGLFLHFIGAKVSHPLTFEANNLVQDMRYLSLVKTGDLLKLGSGVILGLGNYMYQLKDPVTNQLFLYDVNIPDNCFLAGRSYVGVGTKLEENAGVLDRSCTPPFSRVKKSRIAVGNTGQFSMKMSQNAEDWKIERHIPQQLLILLMGMLRSSVNLIPVATLKMIWFQVYQLLMVYLDPSMSIVGVYVSFIAATALNAIFMIVLHNTRNFPRPHSTDRAHLVYSSAYRSGPYWSWLHYNLCLRTLNESILVYTGSSPLSSFLLRILKVGKIGKDFIIDSRGVELSELNFCILGDNVSINSHTTLSPHNISLSHTLDIRELELGDGIALFPRSCVFGGTTLPKYAMLGSHCRPFQSQALQMEHEYNGTPCFSFTESVAAPNALLAKNKITGVGSENALKREDAIEVARSVLHDILEEYGSYPPSDTKVVENIELQLDSVQMMEYANRVMKKTGCHFDAQSAFEAITVGDVADLLISHQVFADITAHLNQQ